MIDKTTRKKITVTVNGTVYEREVNVRTLLSDFLRRELGLTGTHVGCEQGYAALVRYWWTVRQSVPVCC